MILNEIIKSLENELMLKNQENWDNSGLQIGDINSTINKIMLILDINDEAVNFAVENNIDLIITHHPFIFSSLKSLDYNTYEGRMIRKIAINSINVYSIHTNFDMADFGVNYELGKKLGIEKYEILHKVNDDGSGYGGICDIEKTSISQFADFVKKSLNCPHIKLYCTNNKKIVKRVAFCGGSGSEFINDAINKKADVYITGDIKYHQAQDAIKNNLYIIDAGHFNTEIHSLKLIEKVLEKNDDLEIFLIEKNNVNEIII